MKKYMVPVRKIVLEEEPDDTSYYLEEHVEGCDFLFVKCECDGGVRFRKGHIYIKFSEEQYDQPYPKMYTQYVEANTYLDFENGTRFLIVNT